MKKLLLLFGLLFSTFAFSQEYQFDYECSYQQKIWKKGTSNVKPNTIKYFLNSKNNEYIIYNRYKDYFNLYDFKLNKETRYNQVLVDNQILMDKKEELDFRNFKEEFIIKKVDVQSIGDNYFLIQTFDKERSRKPNLELKIKLKKSDFSFVKVLFMDLSVNIHEKVYEALLLKLPNANYQIENIEVDYKNGFFSSGEFEKCKKISLKYNL